MKIKLLGKNLDELKKLVVEEGLPGFTAKQIAQWLYVKKVRSIDDMTNLSKAARAALNERYEVGVVENKGVAAEVDEDLKATVLEAVKKTNEKMDKLRVADAITEIFNIFRRSNKYIDETTPWTLAKDEANKDRLATVLYNLVESITIGASLLESFMPDTAQKIYAQLNTTKRAFTDMEQFGLYPNGNKVVEKPEILFARLDVKEVMEKVEAMKAAEAAANEPAAEEVKENVVDLEKKPEITYEDFEKLQFQIGEIIKCEEVKKSKIWANSSAG